jgi:hypothetical protein
LARFSDNAGLRRGGDTPPNRRAVHILIDGCVVSTKWAPCLIFTIPFVYSRRLDGVAGSGAGACVALGVADIRGHAWSENLSFAACGPLGIQLLTLTCHYALN